MAQPLAAEMAGLQHGVVVEFIGLPGSGKSTIAHALAELLRRRGAAVSEPTWRNDHASRRSSRTLRKAGLALAASARDPLRAGAVVQWIAESAQPTIRATMMLTLNALYLAEASSRCARVPGIHIFDQGVLQQLWSLLYQAGNSEDAERRCAEQIAACGTRLHVVLVDAPLGTLTERLAARSGGASRLEQHLRHSDAQAALRRATSAQRRVEAVADALSVSGAVRMFRVSGAGDRRLAESARAIADWID
jgi:predicted kinase